MICSWCRRWRQWFLRCRYRFSSFWRSRGILIFTFILFALVLVGIIGVLGIFAWYSKDLPSPNQLVRKEGFATRIFDRTGKILYDVYKEAKRNPVRWEDVPDSLKWATIAIEDKHFYSHPGFSTKGMLRAVYNIVVNHRLEGGSTLTQQLIKNELLTSERTISRKIKEFVLSIQTERKYTKDEILLMYLNEAPYGGAAVGIGAAAEQYYGKPVKELNLLEAAILAGLPQRPSYYSPLSGDPEAYIGRTKDVLRRMREDGYISAEEEAKALSDLPNYKFAENKGLLDAPHFVSYVREVLTAKYGAEAVEKGGLRVTTTLDLELQKQAEQIIKDELGKMEKYHITNGAAIVMDPLTGEILAMLGSKDYFADDIQGKFNVVTQGLRQPGSAIKPVTYAVALEKGYTASTLLLDTKTKFPVVGQKDYIPVNYDGKYHGPLQVRYALGNSINVAAVKMLGMVGLETMLQKAYDMGLTTLQPTKENLSRLGLSVTLGGGEVRLIELASAYCSFANGGFRQEPVSILKVEDSNGKVLETVSSQKGPRVLSEATAYIISDILADNNARLIVFGPQNTLRISDYKVAVKTGTTNDKLDNWTIGWNPALLVGVWVGNNDNSPMTQLASGISGAAPIWRNIILEGLRKRPKKDFILPADVVNAEVDEISGYRAHDGLKSRMEIFRKGTEPAGDDPVHVKLKLCRGQNKLATPVQVARGEYEEKEFIFFKEEDPVSTDNQNRWQEGILEWISQQSDSRYHPPTDYCDQSGLVEVAIDSPGGEATVGNQFLIKARTISVKKVVSVKFYVDGQEKASFETRPYEAEVNIADGPHTVKVWAKDEDGRTGESEVKIGVNVPWNWQPSPTPTITPLPTSTPLPSPTSIPSPTIILTPTPTP